MRKLASQIIDENWELILSQFETNIDFTTLPAFAEIQNQFPDMTLDNVQWLELGDFVEAQLSRRKHDFAQATVHSSQPSRIYIEFEE